ncbi:putative receptor protein kinase ZmPK1 [Camellia lanceoleosa]|uniref:Receptor protein kinase ZmPK1 n=1 Tax=Camellia lanceoleosa TaxID=1840588 RepID=A0ACC0HPI3_9ERIC|nr:putative receptor protein kinase ZmPK1 [Camellia lanceoleosa]
MLVIPSSSTTRSTLNPRSSLSVEKPNDILISPNGVFAAGFHPVGDNAFILAIWFAKSSSPTVVWTANRDQPVNGKASKLSLLNYGKLILTDGGQNTIWFTTTTTSAAMVQLALLNTGNLVLNSSKSSILWQSFDSPTDTLLPLQMFTRYTTLVSSRSQTNHSSGFYKLFFDNNNLLSLLYNGPEVSSIYWPDPWLMLWDSGRTTFNISKIAILDTSGYFISSDFVKFKSADLGLGIQRRLTLDFDGNLRLYSLNEKAGNWTVTWQAMADPGRVHGICGPNSICSYGSGSGRGCSCLPGHKIKNQSDWSYGCELEHNLPDNDRRASFAVVDHMELYGYEYNVSKNSTLESCKEMCLQTLICKGFLFKFESGVYNCYAKSQLLNGKHSLNLIGTLYVELNVSKKSGVFSSNAVPVKEMKLNCLSLGKNTVQLDRVYKTNDGNKFLNFLVWFACAIGVVEMGQSRTREGDSEELLEQLPALQQLLYRLIGCRVGISLAEIGEFSFVLLGHASNVHLVEVYPIQQVGGVEADIMAANELNVHAFLQPEEMGIPTKAYYVVEKVKENATQKSQKVFVHVPSEIAAHEIEEIALKGLDAQLQEIRSYLDLGIDGKLLLNHEILCHLQLEVDGKDIPIPKDTVGLIVLNIGSYMGGVDLWQNDYEHDDDFNLQSVHDKTLEVVCISGAWHLGKLQGTTEINGKSALETKMERLDYKSTKLKFLM